jgi:hypothetical protein
VTGLPLEVTSDLPGGPQNWDFTFLSKDIHREAAYRPAVEGSEFNSFPDADLVTIDQAGTERYYDVTGNSFSLTGIHGIDPLDISLPIEMLPALKPPLTERIAPLSFFDIHQSFSGILYYMNAAALPSETLQLFPFSADSFRLRVAFSRVAVANAYGTIMIPGGTYEVLREKHTAYTEKRLDAKIPPLGWLDVTDVALQQTGIMGLGVDTTYLYYYFNDTEKEPIVLVSFNSNYPGRPGGFLQVEFKDVEVLSGVDNDSQASPEVMVSPNPAGDQIFVELKNFVPGHYTLYLLDANGHQVITKALASVTGTVWLNELGSGMYFFQVLDAGSRVMAGGKFLKAGD